MSIWDETDIEDEDDDCGTIEEVYDMSDLTDLYEIERQLMAFYAED